MSGLMVDEGAAALGVLPQAARGAARAVIRAGEGSARPWAAMSDLNVLDSGQATILLDAVNAGAAVGEAGVDRWIIWSGWLGGSKFERDPRTWGPRGLAAWRGWMDRASADLAGSRTRLLVRPHARHAMCDVQRCASWLSELDKAGPGRRELFGLALEPAALLEPEMLPQAEDHLRRAIETLGPKAEVILVSGARPTEDGQGLDLCRADEGGLAKGLIEGLAGAHARHTRLVRV